MLTDVDGTNYKSTTTKLTVSTFLPADTLCGWLLHLPQRHFFDFSLGRMHREGIISSDPKVGSVKHGLTSNGRSQARVAATALIEVVSIKQQ